MTDRRARHACCLVSSRNAHCHTGVNPHVFAMRMAAIFVTSTAGIIRATGIFPLWFVALSYLVAAFLFLAATLSVWLVLVFPVWVVILCALIVIRANTLSPPAGKTVGDDVLEV